MGFFRGQDRPYRQPRKRSGLRLLLFLALVFTGIKFLGSPTFHLHHPFHQQKSKPPLPIIAGTAAQDASGEQWQIYHFSGTRVRGNGKTLDLGDRRTHLPESLLSRFFPDELTLASCLTQPAPLNPAQPPARLPVRDDWPGFYGAPWIAHADNNLIALLHVYAPRKGDSSLASPEFQIYPDYDGQQTVPAFSISAPATLVRGSKAVLYRVFPNGPVRCLDLVVQNGENNGTGHLYYQKYHHYYELDTSFQIQP